MLSFADGVRQRKAVSKVFKELDAFSKVPENYQETSTSGGTVSILVFLFIGVLVISEFIYYSATVTTYKYEVDTDADQKIRINIDMVVAMECDDVGADVLDVSGSPIDTNTNLKLIPTYFAMSSKQRRWWEAFRLARRAEGYRSVNKVSKMDMVFGYLMPTYMPEKDPSEFEGMDFDSCRVFGNIEVNKVSGNFHLTAGKSIPHPRGHAHLSSLVSELNYNFSHRIDLLSFGEPHPGIINPLDGDLQITENRYHMYQYYIKIVPTKIKTLKQDLTTNQYSVTQRSRPVPYGTQGVPGIFFKYNLHAIAIRVTEQRHDFIKFLIRICGIIGGVFATSGMLHMAVGNLADIILCSWKQKKALQENGRVNSANGNYQTTDVSNVSLISTPNIPENISLTQQLL